MQQQQHQHQPAPSWVQGPSHQVRPAAPITSQGAGRATLHRTPNEGHIDIPAVSVAAPSSSTDLLRYIL